MHDRRRMITMVYNTLLFLLLFGMILSTAVNIYLFFDNQQTSRTNRNNLCNEEVLKDTKYCAVIREQLR